MYSGNNGFATSTSAAQSITVHAAAGTTTTTTFHGFAEPRRLPARQPHLQPRFRLRPRGSPLGTVSFYNGSTLLGTANVGSSGAASLVTSGLTASTMSVTAVYSGNNGFATSTSAAQSITVHAAAGTTTSTTLIVLPNPPAAGQATTFTAVISPLRPRVPRSGR